MPDAFRHQYAKSYAGINGLGLPVMPKDQSFINSSVIVWNVAKGFAEVKVDDIMLKIES